jgi:hypothetical protein
VENSATVNLAAGWHAIRLEYFQQGGVAAISLSFRGPNQAKTIIPQAKLRTTLPAGSAVNSSALLTPMVIDDSASRTSYLVKSIQDSTPLTLYRREPSEQLDQGQGTLLGSSRMLARAPIRSPFRESSAAELFETHDWTTLERARLLDDALSG